MILCVCVCVCFLYGIVYFAFGSIDLLFWGHNKRSGQRELRFEHLFESNQNRIVSNRVCRTDSRLLILVYSQQSVFYTLFQYALLVCCVCFILSTHVCSYLVIQLLLIVCFGKCKPYPVSYSFDPLKNWSSACDSCAGAPSHFNVSCFKTFTSAAARSALASLHSVLLLLLCLSFVLIRI